MRYLLCLVAILTCFNATAADCVVTWKDSFRQAVARGLTFNMTLYEGKGSCFTHEMAFLASASNESAVTCDLLFFAGARLAEGWQITVLAEGMPFELVPRSDKHPNPVLRIRAAAGTTRRFVPSRIEVKGPDGCVQWLEALKTN
jgi:hypothetical protein